MDKELLHNELTFKASRSSGPGGQHVNKTSTRIELYWSLKDSLVFSEDQKIRLREKLHNRLTKEQILILSSGRTRSQLKNKEQVIKRFFELLEEALTPPKKRKKSKPTYASKVKRLQSKKQHSEKKASRKKPDF
ncbi:aminoacyl-tRNA hydrolase [Dokdonia pacifica]|uniref:Ribosome-associated protein n=1 Tax=Dokdonia pacifica TaxID=1627892 RepID=A0A238W647_9FLAO|nr:alternative ribosome rescue aminoacyl-tRNA hydrolase ArfB [Dokdonia pacifica]GGG14935.1 aminoacyl-tRNA hydrolase [Dokdonia pacifica]SNR41643.1 ribosome-associated protein [Dokdonia pacifica]